MRIHADLVRIPCRFPVYQGIRPEQSSIQTAHTASQSPLPETVALEAGVSRENGRISHPNRSGRPKRRVRDAYSSRFSPARYFALRFWESITLRN
jgi:hypothetical protein